MLLFWQCTYSPSYLPPQFPKFPKSQSKPCRPVITTGYTYTLPFPIPPSFPRTQPPTQHDQTPNFAALYNILPLLRCLPLGHYAGVRIRWAVYRLATGWTARASNIVRGKILSLLHTRPTLPSDPRTSSKAGIRAVHRWVKRPWHRVEPLPPPSSELNNNNNNR